MGKSSERLGTSLDSTETARGMERITRGNLGNYAIRSRGEMGELVLGIPRSPDKSVGRSTEPLWVEWRSIQ